MVGLALGLPAEQLGLDRHFVATEPFIQELVVRAAGRVGRGEAPQAEAEAKAAARAAKRAEAEAAKAAEAGGEAAPAAPSDAAPDAGGDA